MEVVEDFSTCWLVVGWGAVEGKGASVGSGKVGLIETLWSLGAAMNGVQVPHLCSGRSGSW